jgi:TIR domain
MHRRSPPVSTAFRGCLTWWPALRSSWLWWSSRSAGSRSFGAASSSAIGEGVASAYAGRLAEALEARFGRRVFIDIDGLAAGEDFVTGIDLAVRTSSVVLVVMHEGWVDYRNAEGARSLDDPDDFVRLEIAAALSAGTRIVPLLMNGAAMPREDRLPADIAPLARRQALVIRDADWQYHIEKLTKAIASSLPKRR